MRSVVIVAFPDVQVLDVSGPAECLAMANRWLPPNVRYQLSIAAPRAGMLRTSCGLQLVADMALGDVAGPVDTLIVAGGEGISTAVAGQEVVAGVSRLAWDARRVASVCTGAFVLGAAGLLSGRRATTHWASCEALASRHPDAVVEPDPIFIRDGPVWTSAGVTAGIDLTLAFVQEDHGRDLALRVARQLVVFLQRPGGQSQFSAQLEAQLAGRTDIAELQAWIADHPDGDLRVDALAELVNMSSRNFARIFREQVGSTPARYVERVRVEAARRLLEDDRPSLDEVARACGYSSSEVLRRSFHRALGVSPDAYRARFRATLQEVGS